MRGPGKLCDLAQAEIDALVADGLSLSPEEIVRINHMAWLACDAETRQLLSRGLPIRVGGAVLWPLTLRAAEWFQRVGCGLEPQARAEQALAYAMAHGRSSGSELDVDGSDAGAAVKSWADALWCRQQELVYATHRLLDQDGLLDAIDAAAAGECMTPGDLSAFLVAAGGGPVEMWERQVSIGYVSAFLTAVAARDGDGKLHGTADPKVRALRAVGLYVEEIRRSRLEPDNG